MSIPLSSLTDRQKAMIPAEQRQAMGPAAETTAEALERAEFKSEKALQTAIIEYLRLHGIEEVLCARMDQKSTINRGWPDLTFALPVVDAFGDQPKDQEPPPVAIPCAWEVKLPNKHPEPHQSDMHARLAKGGWQVAVIHSITEARAELTRLGVI